MKSSTKDRLGDAVEQGEAANPRRPGIVSHNTQHQKTRWRRHRPWHRKLGDELAFRYGLQPWMIVLGLVLSLAAGGSIYFFASGRSISIPAPNKELLPP